jgi:probable phosphoglycerate mutase
MTELPPGATTLLLVRHGRTALNVEERYLGALDPPLDAFGWEQASTLASMLRGQADAIGCSPKLRAMQTAGVLATAWGMPLRPVNEFAERNVGVFEGLTREQARAAYPALWEQNITRQWSVGPPGGETIEAVVNRVMQGLDILRRDYPGQVVVLVAHGFIAKVIRAVLLNLSWSEFFRYAMKNGEVERYSLTGDATLCWPSVREEGCAPVILSQQAR